mmetsp:Transcript_23725/g.55289  ORF Transcript_23725/g.55289 Transcript_23725/m.55289 type:complete len:226 (-) Transcript_23725:1751-2428(-)
MVSANMTPQAGKTPPAITDPIAPMNMNPTSGAAISHAREALNAFFSASSISAWKSGASSSSSSDFLLLVFFFASASASMCLVCAESTSLLYLPLGFAMSSECDPYSSTFPFATNAIRSTLRMVDSLWAMTMVVCSFDSMSWSSAACTTDSDSVSRADVASSRRSTFGFLTSARAIATRCFWPPESCVPLSPTDVSYPSGNSMIVWWMLACTAACSISFCVAPGAP